ncbi:hypothetical protein [Streptomyces sp. Qhu_M48]|uniref:hypothetical protein n=1 Tax=Streptomyces sp. Qhu_M48 TaxID=3435889 RepID=UPI003F4FD65A
MALVRLVNGPLRRSFTPADVQPLRSLARALPASGRDQEMQLRYAARICTSVSRRAFRSASMPAVRESVLTIRTPRHI